MRPPSLGSFELRSSTVVIVVVRRGIFAPFLLGSIAPALVAHLLAVGSVVPPLGFLLGAQMGGIQTADPLILPLTYDDSTALAVL